MSSKSHAPKTPSRSHREPTRRQKMVASEIFEILSASIVRQLSDPRVHNISITHVEVSGDLHHAKVFVTSSSEAKDLERALEGLNSAGGFLRKQLAAHMGTRKVPDLQFFRDDVIYNAWELEKVIESIEPKDPVDG
ncbi:30S ribosome-binding factor RbfA [Myxococcota bacterium]|nr:30S ribosome-binding factor RbfA [Myxococcota bacterium]